MRDYKNYRAKKKNSPKTKKSLPVHIMVLIIVIGLLIPGSLILVEKAQSNTLEKYNKVQIASGDTLWKLARKHVTEKQDIRKFIYEIREINNLETAQIYPGQTIMIPASQE